MKTCFKLFLLLVFLSSWFLYNKSYFGSYFIFSQDPIYPHNDCRVGGCTNLLLPFFSLLLSCPRIFVHSPRRGFLANHRHRLVGLRRFKLILAVFPSLVSSQSSPRLRQNKDKKAKNKHKLSANTDN